jgi:hypothetical protein
MRAMFAGGIRRIRPAPLASSLAHITGLNRRVMKRGIIRHITIEVHDSILERRGLSWSRTHEVILECGYGSTDNCDCTVYSFAGSG